MAESKKFKLTNNLRQTIELTDGTSLGPMEWRTVSKLSNQQNNLIAKGHIRCIEIAASPAPKAMKGGK